MYKEKVYVPPIKIQGIKTKLVPFIKDNVVMDDDAVWIEPFMGSGVVGFNIAPQKAIFADTNPHIIKFYKELQAGVISAAVVREYLEREGELLNIGDDKYYYEVRNRFNKRPNSLDFLFLNRACFNGMIRFNKNYEFNVPYNHKRERFSKGYITKIVNQVRHLEDVMRDNSWEFVCQPFEKTILEAPQGAFIYCDPPYIGRHVDYYDSWDEALEVELRNSLIKSGQKFMVSTWDHNKYRNNEYIDRVWGFCSKVTKEHFYYLGARETNRNSVIEALLMNY